jgi:oligopeptide/dipeptide ABC transporter ATP-binding protein
MTQHVLEVEHLSKDFPVHGGSDVVHAVNDVSFRLERGESLGLVGESGSGKTTVGRCILKLTDLSAGVIRFLDRDVTALREAEFRSLRPHIQMVFQDPGESLNPRMSIGAIIEEPLTLQRRLSPAARKERVRDLMRLVRLEASDPRAYPHQLSTGQQQRVGIARAIATSPDLVVLDEPTSALDVSVRAEILDLLARLREQLGLAFIFISHDLTAVERVTNRVAIMYLGRLVEVGPTRQVFTRQAHPYGRALLSAVLYPDPLRIPPNFDLQGEIPSPVNLPDHCSLYSRCPLAAETCRTAIPSLLAVDDAHTSACFRIPELLAIGVPPK